MHLDDSEEAYFITPTKKYKPNQGNSSGKICHKSSAKSNPFEKFINGQDSKTPLLWANDSRVSEPQKDSRPIRAIQSSNFMHGKSAEKIYKQFVQNFKKGIQPELTQLFFTKNRTQTSTGLTKLIAMNFNQKNSKNVVYNSSKGTIIPLFKCEQCYKNFDKASALGGHLSRCPLRKSARKRQTISKQDQIQYFQSNSSQGNKKISECIKEHGKQQPQLSQLQKQIT